MKFRYRGFYISGFPDFALLLYASDVSCDCEHFVKQQLQQQLLPRRRRRRRRRRRQQHAHVGSYVMESAANAKELQEDTRLPRHPLFSSLLSAIMRTPMIKFRYVKGMHPAPIPL